MYTIGEYNNLKVRYGAFASWAIWNLDKPEDTEIIDRYFNNLHSKFVLLGLNVSRKLQSTRSWVNYHDNTHARKLRYACNNTILSGSYMTDLFKDMVEPHSGEFIRNLTPEVIAGNINRFKQEMKDIKINNDTRFILFGGAVTKYFNAYFRQDYGNCAVNYNHYSDFRRTDREWVEGFWKKLGIISKFEG